MSYPETLAIQPLRRSPKATISVPGSKSITNRALVLAALSGQKDVGCTLHGALRCEDTEVMIEALRQLGFEVYVDWDQPESILEVRSSAGVEIIPAPRADLFVANSGTTLRFLTAMLSLGQGSYRLRGTPRMQQRPAEDLLHALRQVGTWAVCQNYDGCPPVRIEARGWHNDHIRVRGDISSQFLSGLLMAAPRSPEFMMVIEVKGPLVSQPYVAMTVAMMRQFGAQLETNGMRRFRIPGQQQYRAHHFTIEPDASAAGYFLAAAAITQGEVIVPRLGVHSLQGDVRFAQVLAAMGCEVDMGESALRVRGRPLYGIDIDMNDMSDCVMTLAAVACFARGPTRIRNVAHIRHKETDRLAALATELARIGMGVEEHVDGLTIQPGVPHGAIMETYDDHRMAMSMALIGLQVPGIILRNPGCVVKTYPEFFTDLEKLRC